MTKEKFQTMDKNSNIRCLCCGKIKHINCFSYREIRSDGENASRCKVCDWLKRNHNSKLPEIPGFSNDDIMKTLEFCFDTQDYLVNDLSKIVHRTIDDTIKLLYKLNLKNIPMRVQLTCEYCKKEIVKPICVYIKNHDVYCSLECYWNDKPTKSGYGEDNPSYKKIKTNCTNCGKPIKITPYDYNIKNKFGDNHNFCSQKCYWEFRSKYYINEKSAMYNHRFTPEQREASRKRFLNQIKKSNRLDTKIQLIVNDILDRNNISFEREKTFDYYSVDNYLPEINGIIEVMGDFWHSSPLRYNKNKYFINEIQQKQIHRDKLKYSYIKHNYNINILYLWENDINNNLSLCEELIKQYIFNKGILENYHSFNWNFINGKIELNKNLIIPYQDMKIDDYRNLIKKKAG